MWNKLLLKWLFWLVKYCSRCNPKWLTTDRRRLRAYFCYSEGSREEEGEGELEGSKLKSLNYYQRKGTSFQVPLWHLGGTWCSAMASAEMLPGRPHPWTQRAVDKQPSLSRAFIKGSRKWPQGREGTLHEQGAKETLGFQKRTKQRRDAMWVYNSGSQTWGGGTMAEQPWGRTPGFGRTKRIP